MADIGKPSDKNQDEISIDDVNAHIAEAKQPKRKIKVKAIDVYKSIRHMANGGQGALPPFETRFHVIRDERGERAFLEETKGQVLKHVSMQRIIDVFGQYADTVPMDGFELTADKVKTCAEYWAMMQEDLAEEIAPVRQKSEKGYTYHRLPFNFAEGAFPLFTEMFSRISNAEALKAWIGSLFDPHSDRQQYVWLFGEGRNGKSTLGRMLGKVLGQACRFEQVPDKSDKFWTSGLIGKRLIIFPDCNNYGYPASGAFKALTGGDAVRLERKNKDAFSATLDCKFLFFSNDKPKLSSGEADMRRAIYCEIGPITEDFGPTYEKQLWEETPHFIAECLNTYRAVTKDSVSIPTDLTLLRELVDSEEERYELFADQYLNLGTFENDKLCTPMEMSEAFRHAGIRDGHTMRQYKSYLSRKFGVKLQAVRMGEKVEKRYLHCTRKALYPFHSQY